MLVVSRSLAAGEPWRAAEQPDLKQALEQAPVLQTESLGEPHLPNWRAGRLPRMEVPPDGTRIQVVSRADGQADVIGQSGATGDARALMVRVINLCTADQVFVPVGEDGTFRASLFAPPGSSLQVNSLLLTEDEMPPEKVELLRTQRAIAAFHITQEPVDPFIDFLATHSSSSPGTLLPVMEPRASSNQWVHFVKRTGADLRLFGRARASAREAQPGGSLQIEVTLNAVCASADAAEAVARQRPELDFLLHILFDKDGQQRPPHRLSVSHLLTPTRLPIETRSEMVAEPQPYNHQVWHPGPSGCHVPRRLDEAGSWQVKGKTATITQRYTLEVPDFLPTGCYSLDAHIWGLGEPQFADEGLYGGVRCVGYLKVGSPARPRLSCLLLASTGTGGSRGTVAREDVRQFAVNPRNVFMPEKLVIPRDDAYTGQPIKYPLDPYLPMLSLTDRPPPVIPPPLIPFDFKSSTLTVTVTTPQGKVETLGPAPLVGGQNDLSVLRPDYVYRDRILPPLSPTYGNPSLSDIYHLTGRGAFDYAFKQYGHYQIRLAGEIKDVMGTAYAISDTYDVYVAKPLDVDVFPEPGTPLEPGVGLSPQVRVLPALPAEVEMVWRHYPRSDASRMVERKVSGRANRFGVFVPAPDVAPVQFAEPGEYLCDVTVRYQEPGGALWMVTRRGASVVVTPNSKVIVHGERGNRSPTARWRARWFVAGDGRFIAPPDAERPRVMPPDAPPEEPPPIIGFGHTCYPYESGDVAWLGDHDPFSLFPNLTFEDPEGTLAQLIEERWGGVREGEGREGLYPRHLLPEDRRAIGELPYVCMTTSGLPPTLSPSDVDRWGYFYTTSWRPGVGVRAQVSEDMVPTGYWFFDDPYGYQYGNGPVGDLAGDVKMNYGGGVFRDAATRLTHYGAYASMLVLLPNDDPRRPRVQPPFDGLLPGSPPSGPLLEIGGKRYDVFLTFGAVAPSAILEVGDRLSVAGVVWPPVSGSVRGTVRSPSGKQTAFDTRANAVGVFDHPGAVASEPGVWTVTAEGICTGRTSAGTISELVSEARFPRGGGIGLPEASFAVPVVPKNAQAIAFDLPLGSRAAPPRPLVIRGHLPTRRSDPQAGVIVSLPGQVIDYGTLPVCDGQFDYVYDPQELKKAFPNIDTVAGVPRPGWEFAPAWFDTVVFTFWAGEGKELTAGTVLLQGEEVIAQASTGQPMPAEPSAAARTVRMQARAASVEGGQSARGAQASVRAAHSSLLALALSGDTLLAGHPWSGEVVLLDVRSAQPRVIATARTGGEVRSVAFSPNGTTVYAAADKSQVVVLDAATLKVTARYDVPGRPWAVLPSADGTGIFVADFDGDRVLRLAAASGKIEATSDTINRPSCLALSPDGSELFTVSFRTGEILVLNSQCATLRRLSAPSQLNQCRTVTLAPDGLLYAPQTRSDTVVGGRTFDRTVFPVIAAADPRGQHVSLKYFPDLLVVPPHRPSEVAVDAETVYLASAGSDDVLAIQRNSGFAKWHTRNVGLEPGGIALDPTRGRLYVLTITGQEIVSLSAESGAVLGRAQFAHDPTPPTIARGRYLFGTGTDKRLTKDQWMSCAICHPQGDTDGRQWNLGSGPLDTRSLRGCLQTAPLHLDAHGDEIQDTYDFTRLVMGGQWFVPRERLHDYLAQTNAGVNEDLDALADYIRSLTPLPPLVPPAATAPLRQKGKEIFFSRETRCAQCHPPPLYTDSGRRDAQGRYLLHDVGTRLPYESATLQRLDTPSLLGLWRSEPYLHHGRAKTLEEVFSRRFNPQDKHGRTSHVSEEGIRALAEFLRYLDAYADAGAGSIGWESADEAD
jgi:YVTN family beta-propeller protein